MEKLGFNQIWILLLGIILIASILFLYYKFYIFLKNQNLSIITKIMFFIVGIFFPLIALFYIFYLKDIDKKLLPSKI